MSYEVTDIKRLLDELQRANFLNAILLDSIPHPALLINKSRMVIAANKLAKDAGTLVGGFCWRDFGHCLYLNDEDRKHYESYGINNGKDLACNFCQANNALGRGECRNIEMKLGDIYWDIYWIPTQEDDIYLHYAIDITERKKTEKRLKESELRFKKLTEVSFEGICIHAKGIILDCNARMEVMFGYDEGELTGTSLCNIISTEMNKAPTTPDKSEPTNINTYFGIKKNGTRIDIEVLTREIQYDGLIAEVLVVRDIPQYDDTEKTTRAINIIMKDAQRFAHVGSIEIDICNRKMYWSDEACRIFGYQPQEFHPDLNLFYKHISSEDLKLIRAIIKEKTSLDSIFTFETRFIKLDGKEGWLNVRGDAEFYNLDSKPSRVFIILQDITDRKQAELIKKVNEENIRLLHETLEMDRLKNEFFANISHELRTPLNIIFSTVQLYELYLRMGLVNDAEDRIGKGIKGMKQNCYRLLRLINNLIDITKVDGGFISLKLENHDIVGVVRRICISVAEYVTSKNIIFTFNSDINEKVIACDPDKIETIILNLISNAIKFNKVDGKVMVNIHNAGKDILISVEDTGIGIPVERQGEVFERFMQVDKTLARDREGSGIGLSLVKAYVEMHEGQIWLESEYGKGSKFLFRLPCKVLDTERIRDGNNIISQKGNSDFIDRINIEFSDIYA